MRRGPIALLYHAGHGRPHCDLILDGPGRCPTWHLHPAGTAWAARPGRPHRRAYLTYRGPVAGGRGRVAQLWTGLARWSRPGRRWQLRFADRCWLFHHGRLHDLPGTAWAGPASCPVPLRLTGCHHGS